MTEDLFNRKSLRQALKQWTAVARLSRHPLTNLHLVTARVLPQMSNEVITPTDRAQALRQVLREAIDTLKPTADEPDFTAREWRDYLILSEQYLNRRQAQALRDMLALSESGYFHEQKRALDRLGSYLRQQENALQAAAESVLHLPFYPTPFLGREKELQQIASLLAKPECRLLTLMGPGGGGQNTAGSAGPLGAGRPMAAWNIFCAPGRFGGHGGIGFGRYYGPGTHHEYGSRGKTEAAPLLAPQTNAFGSG